MKNTPENFYGGKISDNFANWRRLTSDKWILQQVRGVQVEFQDNPSNIPHKREIVFNSTEDELVKQEISSFIKKGIIQEVEPVEDQVLSNIFLREKKDGSQRVILNLKFLNETIDKVHFKMDSLKHTIALIKRGCWFASVDLKDAYFSVKISPEYQKFFRFVFLGKLYEFLALPQGFRDSPRIFTKLLKPALSCLRCLGHTVLAFIDDTLLQGDTEQDCLSAVMATCQVFDSLGFTVHPVKSVLQPTQKIEFLGFWLDSVNMMVSLTDRKVDKIRSVCAELLDMEVCSIRHMAEIIGYLVAAHPGVWVAPVYYKRMEIAKNAALSENCGNFDASMRVPDSVREDLLWWTNNVDKFPSPVQRSKSNVVVKSDASMTGWGA